MRPIDVQQAREAAVKAAERAEKMSQILARLRISESIRNADAMSVFQLGLYIQGLEQQARPKHSEVADEIAKVHRLVTSLIFALNPEQESTPTVIGKLTGAHDGEIQAAKPAGIPETEDPTVVSPLDGVSRKKATGSYPTTASRHFEGLIQGDRAKFDNYLAEAIKKDGFTELEPLSQGGMGIVYTACEEALGRTVLIKINKITGDPMVVESFLREGKSAAGIGTHPNIAAVFRTGTVTIAIDGIEGIVPYHALEYLDDRVDGRKIIKELIDTGKSLPTEVALDLILQIARGLSAAHQKGVAHRDVKPENALFPKEIIEWIRKKNSTDAELIEILADKPEAKLIDFGLASIRKTGSKKQSSAEHREGESLSDGSIVGTVGYIAPEGYDNGVRNNYAADVYALGVMLYQFLFAGKMPFVHSVGIRAETPKTVLGYGPKMLSNAVPGIAGADKDPEIKQLNAKHPKNSDISQLGGEMTAYKAEDRPLMDIVVESIQEILGDRSENSLMLSRINGRMRMILASIVIVAPLIFGAFKLQRQHFLKERQQTYQTITQALKISGKHCFCEQIKAMEEYDDKDPNPEKLPTDEQYQEALKCLRQRDGELPPQHTQH